MSRVFLTILFVGLLSAALLAPRRGPAQPGAPLPGMMPTGVVLPAVVGSCCKGFRVGSWVEYLVIRRDTRARWHLRMAVVGREQESWWMEMTIDDARHGEAICKLLMNPDEEGGLPKRVIVQPEGHIPLELTSKSAPTHLPELESGGGENAFVGNEQVRLHTGRSIATRHYRRGEGDGAHHVWLSESVPLWGLVRYLSPRVNLILRAQGTGAASRIIGEPVPFDPSTF